MEVLIPLVSALFAALVGAWINDRYRRPRLRLIPTSLRLSTSIIPEGSVVEPNSDLLTLCSENPNVPGPPFLAVGKVDEREYVAYLTEVLDVAQTSVRVDYPAIAERAQELQAKLSADDLDGVARIWQREQFQLWPAIEGPYIRREFMLDPLPSGEDSGSGRVASAGQALKYDVSTDPDGTVFVMQQGAPYIALVFTPMDRRGAAGERSKELANRLGLAFANGVKPDLIAVFNFLARIENLIPGLENLRQKIELELARLKRLSVTALISNAGGTPVSISNPRCSMTLHVKGFVYRVGDGDDARRVVQRDEQELELQLVDSEGRSRPPIIVESGGVEAVLGVYAEALSAEPLTDGGSLYNLVRSCLASERTWTLAAQAVLPRDPSKTIESRRTSFQDLKEPDRKRPISQQQGTDDAAALKRKIQGQDTELSATRAELSRSREYAATLETARLQLLSLLAAQDQREVPTTPETNGPGSREGSPHSDQA